MSNLATYLQVGDMVSLEGDPVFDPACKWNYCPHRTENSELIEIEEDGDFLLRMTFEDSRQVYTKSVTLSHRFADPE